MIIMNNQEKEIIKILVSDLKRSSFLKYNSNLKSLYSLLHSFSHTIKSNLIWYKKLLKISLYYICI